MENIKFTERQIQIIKVAIELLNEKGYNDLSLRDIAKKIGIKAPAIYWHFKNKTILIDYIAEYLLQQTFVNLKIRSKNQLYQDWLYENILLLRKAMLSCKDGGRIIAGAHLYPTVTLATFIETAVASLRSAGLSFDDSRHIVMTAIHYTYGHVIEEQSGRERLDFDYPIDYFKKEDFSNLLEMVQLPSKRKDYSEDQDFIEGLKLIIPTNSYTSI